MTVLLCLWVARHSFSLAGQISHAFPCKRRVTCFQGEWPLFIGLRAKPFSGIKPSKTLMFFLQPSENTEIIYTWIFLEKKFENVFFLEWVHQKNKKIMKKIYVGLNAGSCGGNNMGQWFGKQLQRVFSSIRRSAWGKIWGRFEKCSGVKQNAWNHWKSKAKKLYNLDFAVRWFRLCESLTREQNPNISENSIKKLMAFFYSNNYAYFLDGKMGSKRRCSERPLWSFAL